jgi:hippurate hydrolase
MPSTLSFHCLLSIQKGVIVLSIAILPLIGRAQKPKTSATLLQTIQMSANADSARLIGLFKDIHQHPELAFQETRTASIVAAELRSLGFDVIEHLGQTGVVGVFKNGKGPTVMYRADMDCNAVQETTGLSYASKRTAVNGEGVEVPMAHACGHDAHTTWMLGMAKILVNNRKAWKGTLVLVAQPAEENGLGAKAMQAEMYELGVPVPNYLLGIHTAPVALGYYLNRAGDRMAGADQLDVTFYGIGGHGSMPQETKDPVLMAAWAVIQYQSLISRSMDPQHPAVLTVGAIHAGIDNNVIPANATLKINLRWFSESDRTLLLDGIERINQGIAISHGLPQDLYPTTTIKQTVSPLTNDAALVAHLNPVLEALLGPNKNLPYPPVMGSEDFQHLVQPGSTTTYNYLLLGIVKPSVFAAAQQEGKRFPYTNHNGDFWVDPAAIPLGTAVAASMVMETFQK